VERAAKLCLCLAGGLVLNTGARAGDLVSADNPYVPIVTRNVFDIHPPPPVDPNAQPAEPPPKITPNGITGIFGRLQVLFKVSLPAKAGQQAKDQFYMLNEGQAQDDIEVTKIDEKNSVVTFNNHGTVQELPLAVGTASGPAGSAPGPGANVRGPGFAPVGGNPGNPGNSGGGGVIPFGSRFGQSGGFSGQNPKAGGVSGTGFSGMNSGIGGGANYGSSFGVAANNSGFSAQFGGATTAGGSSQPGAATANTGTINYPALNGMTPEEIQALIAANHAAAQQAGNPWAGLYPPTRFDTDAGLHSPSTPGGSTAR